MKNWACLLGALAVASGFGATDYEYAYPQYVVEMAAGASNALRHVSGIVRYAAAGAAGETVSYADFRADATSGSLLKDGPGTLTVDESIAGFDGQVHVREGVLIACCSNALGKTTHQDKPLETERAYVHAGATLVMDDPQARLVRQEANSIYFEGSGAPGLGGALVARNGNLAGGSGKISYWPFGVRSQPTGPATVYVDAPADAELGITYAAGGARSSNFSFNGQETLLYGRTAETVFTLNAGVITGVGHLTVSNLTLRLTGNSAALHPQANVDSQIRFAAGSRLRWNKFDNLSGNEQKQKSRLVVDGLECLALAQTRDYPAGVNPFEVYETTSNYVWWCGPVELNRDLRLYNEYSPTMSKSTKRPQGITFEAKISGAGGIRPYAKSGASWGQGLTLNLMATDSDFGGGIVLDGSTLAVWNNGAVPAQEGAGLLSVTNGGVRFCRLPQAAAWPSFAMPDAEFVGSCAVTNGTGRWRSLVKKGEGALDYNSQMGGGLLDVRDGLVALNVQYRASYAGDAGFVSAPPAFDAVRLAPGTTLALAGEDLTVASLSGAGAVTGGGLVVGSALTAARADLAAGRALMVAGTLRFAPGSVVSVSGAEPLAARTEGYLVATAAQVEGAPQAAPGWRVVTTATEVRLRPERKGFLVILDGKANVPPPPVLLHTVTYRRLNGTVLERRQVADGAEATVPEGPAENGYRFVGWERAERLGNVTADFDVHALYEAETAKSPSTTIASKDVAARETPYSLEEYLQLYDTVAWSDEFSESALNVGTKSTWGSTYKGGNWNYDMEQRNGELHKHKEDCLTVSDGCLHVACKRETNGSYQFASGGVKSNGKVAFKFGRCEIRAKLCRGLGVWPAFWMMGSTGNWPNCGEIDVLEQMNGGEWIASTLHLPHPTEQYATIETQGTCGPTDGIHWGDGFHRFGVIINAREIVFYTDDMIHKRIDIRDPRYNLIRDRAQYVIMGSGMGGAWSGVTDPSMVPAAFLREDYVVDYCRIFTNPTEGRTVSRAVSTAKPAGPVSATVWKGWEMNWGHSGAGAYQNDITTNGFTEAFYVNEALNRHVERDLPDVIVFLTEPACKTGYENGHFWTNLQLKAEGMLVGHYGQNGDKTRENLLTTVLYDGRRFSAGDSPCATLTINDASFTNYLTVAAELVERETGATVKVVGVNLNVSCSAAELQPLYDYLGSIRVENAIVLVQGMSSGAYNSFKNTATSLDSAYRLLGEDAGGYRRAYATGTGAAVKPAALTIVDPARPKKVSSHTMQALQATVTF